MSQFENDNPDTNQPDHRLSDGRADVGDSFAHATGPDGDSREVGRAFEDTNSYDDRKVGKAFDQSSSNAKKPHKHLGDIVHAPKNRRPLYWFLAIVVVVFVLAFLVGWISRRGDEKDTAQRSKDSANAEPIIETVKVTHAKSGTGLTVPGTTTALAEAYVYARANGYLKRRLVDIGDHVRKGQLLAIIDSPDLDQQVDQAREQVRQAEAQLNQQRSQLTLTNLTVDRYRALVAKGVFSRQDGDQATANYETSVANVAAAERNVEAYKANLGHVIALQSYERVTAPFDGIITQRNVDQGALISTSGSGAGASPAPMNQIGTGSQAGATNSSGASGNGASLATPATGANQGGALFSVAQVQRLCIFVSVPEGYAGMIAPGQHATIYFQEQPKRTYTADVTRTSRSIDQNTRTLLVEVQLDNHDGALMPGMYAVATFAATNGQGPLVISGEAIAIRKDRPVVGVIGSDGKVHIQPIEIGRDYGSETEIVGGLQEGQIIAATFTDDIVEGAPVKVQPNTKDQQQAAPASKPTTPTPPGGSTQYSDPGITDQDMQGQDAKPQQKGGKQSGGAQKKGSGSGESRPDGSKP